MNQREYRIGPGAASLMLLVVVLSMSALGMLAMMSARSDESLSLRSQDVARQVAELNVSAEQSLARLDAVLAEEPEAGMTLLGRTVSWTETNDEGRTLICAVELQERGAFPRYVKAVYRLVTDEGEPDGEERLFDAAGEL